ncbi:MAG: hypothetical protein ACE363_14310 [Alphaproteobacteria bacterium]
MNRIETVVRREAWDVARRLSEMGLDRQKFLNVRDVALSAMADATPFHPANAAGTFAYQHGTFALRSEFVGDEWVVDRNTSVEAIRNDNARLRVVYSNVDIACDDNQKPMPRSRKGAGSERICNGNLFPHLPEYVLGQDDEYETFFLMVDERGACELTKATIKGGSFSEWPERIYLADGADPFDGEAMPLDDEGPIDNFDPQVIRK